MSRSHYEVLGVSKGATQSEIKTAYRRLVLELHPDRTSEPGALAAFLQVTQAYEILGDWDRRIQYDKLLEMGSAKPAAKPRTKAYAATGKAARSAVVSAEVTRLTLVHSRGQMSVAEKLAQKILGYDSRQPIPYAVLGDIRRAQGRSNDAAKMYALAVQMDPTNEVYHQRHEEMVSFAVVKVRNKERENIGFPLSIGLGLIILAAIYLVVSMEKPLMPDLPPVSTWTLGVWVMTFLSGVALGASFCYAGLVDRFSSVATTALGRITPVVALATIAIVNFWVAAALYMLLGYAQKGFNYSTSRMVSAVAGVTLLLAFAARFSAVLSPLEVLAWGGNLVYIGALSGWMVADSMRA
ncbi:MAG: J domain-containing protein [Fimbriimonadaceae bacterium]